MTEKRFTIIKDENHKSKGIFDNITQREIFQWGYIARLLNGFHNRYIWRVSELKKENEQLKKQIEELEFNLRTIEAFDRTAKEEHSDTVYDFKKKLEKW